MDDNARAHVDGIKRDIQEKEENKMYAELEEIEEIEKNLKSNPVEAEQALKQIYEAKSDKADEEVKRDVSKPTATQAKKEQKVKHEEKEVLEESKPQKASSAPKNSGRDKTKDIWTDDDVEVIREPKKEQPSSKVSGKSSKKEDSDNDSDEETQASAASQKSKKPQSVAAPVR